MVHGSKNVVPMPLLGIREAVAGQPQRVRAWFQHAVGCGAGATADDVGF
jgi:hypothetical protein